MKYILYTFSVFILLYASCDKEDPDTKLIFQSEWTDFIEKGELTGFGGDEIDIKINKDIFYYHYSKWSDVVIIDPCVNYIDNSYATGKYIIDGEMVFVNGHWTDEKFGTKNISPCIRTGEFELIYKVDSLNKSTIYLTMKPPLRENPWGSWGIKKKLVLYKK
ncbi:MAG: hypothetical protein ABI543_10035 [Ignavibacteria bacterium]